MSDEMSIDAYKLEKQTVKSNPLKGSADHNMNIVKFRFQGAGFSFFNIYVRQQSYFFSVEMSNFKVLKQHV